MAMLFRNTLIFGGISVIAVFAAAVFLARRIVSPLEESYQKQKQFISDAGHELKTPVSVVSANAELLAREIGENKWLSNIQYENERMGSLVRQLLELVRAENAVPQTERLNLSRLTSGELLPFESYDSEITTTSDNSGGIQTTGGGTVNVNGGTYTSDGYNSPAVYSTAAITVADATLSANNSEALVIEGKNSIALANCTVYGNMSDTKGSSSDENVHNIMIYQSMSGDADVGTSVFSMTGGSLTSNNGDMFYITNTACNITLSDVTIVNKDSDAYLMNIRGNSASHGWGTAGKNGAQVVFSADGQILAGDIAVDTISTLNMTLKGNSTFTGTINITENKEGGTAVSDNAVITVESGSTWNLTGNCTVTSLTNNGTVNFNGYTITLADGTVLK